MTEEMKIDEATIEKKLPKISWVLKNLAIGVAQGAIAGLVACAVVAVVAKTKEAN